MISRTPGLVILSGENHGRDDYQTQPKNCINYSWKFLAFLLKEMEEMLGITYFPKTRVSLKEIISNPYFIL